MAAPFSNLLLSALGDKELGVLRPHLAQVDLAKGEWLEDAVPDVRHLYFVEAGVLAVMASSMSGEQVAVALIGREGVGGALAALGGEVMRQRLLVEIAGSAFRIESTLLQRQRPELPRLLRLIDRYVQLLVTQIAQSAICNRYHSARQRLARWLLLTADVGRTTDLAVTHRLLADMLGGARPLVTIALGELRREGALETDRSSLTVKRKALAKQVCECYHTVDRARRAYLGEAHG